MTLALRASGLEGDIFVDATSTAAGFCRRSADSDLEGDIFVDSVAYGLIVYYWGKGLYLNDDYALADPLLARMPGVYDKSWMVGHIHHLVPPGYRESAQTGENRIQNASLALYYDKISLITRSENLFAPERLKAIWDINLGKYDHLLAAGR
jgi:arabinofuranosyltransferase